MQNLQVLSGVIPRDIEDGQFVRNGPNPQFDFTNKPYFWFDGDGMLHAIHLHDGKADYVNRFIHTKRFESDRKLGESVAELAELSCGNSSVLGKTGDENGERMGKANTALVFHNRRAFALEENDKPYIIKLPSLDTIGRFDYNGKLSHNMTAHPLVDEATGEMMFFGYDVKPTPPFVHYSVADAKGTLVRTIPIHIREDAPIMMHSFAITQHYSVIMDLPLRFEFANMNGWKLYEVGSRFGVLPRHATSSDEVHWFDAETGMIFHTANAWEEGDEIVLIACRSRRFQFQGLSTVTGKGPQTNENETRTFLYEYRFNLKTGKTNERQLLDQVVEFPVINVAKTGYPTRYIYAARFIYRGPTSYMDGVVKYDVQTSTHTFHSHQGLLGGECVFVPRAKAIEEDDGYLVTFLYDEKTHQSQFVMIDARTMAAEPVCRIAAPQRVPFGFHGTWFPKHQIDAQLP